MTITVRDAALDLLLGSSCVGCARPGRLLCRDCTRALPRQAIPARPTPAPAGLVGSWAAAPYESTVRSMVLGLKEERLLGLATPLAGLLALAVCTDAPQGALTLVPVPSRASTVRARGHDATATLARLAAARLRRTGRDVRVTPLLRLRPGVEDQSGLDAEARAANLSGSMHVATPALRSLVRRRPWAAAVVCDDVLTTGSTAREAQRALEAVGLRVERVAVVAATRRRSMADGSREPADCSADLLSSGPATH